MGLQLYPPTVLLVLFMAGRLFKSAPVTGFKFPVILLNLLTGFSAAISGAPPRKPGFEVS